MSSNGSAVNESVGELVPVCIFNHLYNDLDGTVLRVEDERPPAAELAQNMLQKFNEAWDCTSETPTTTISVSPADCSSTMTASYAESSEFNLLDAIPEKNSRKSPITTSSEVSQEQPGPSGLQIVDSNGQPSVSCISQGPQLSLTSSNDDNTRTQQGKPRNHDTRNPRKRRKSCSEDDDAEKDEDESRQRRHTRSRRPRSRYYSRSRSRSRSPGSRRRYRRRSRSRSRHLSRSVPRSRSISRSSRSSRSSERERRYRPRSRHTRHTEPAALPVANQGVAPTPDMGVMQSMLTMAMQIALASTSNRMQPVPFGDGLQTTPNAQQMPSLTVNQPSSVQTPEPDTHVEEKSQYDVPTELFLEGKINLGEYLSMKPLSREQRMVNPKVCERLKEAISILDQQETKEQTAKFLYVPPNYYSVLRKKDMRSPLVWNDRNVLFGLTSRSREVKLCEPFGNVNVKLKGLIAKFGLDEGVISQRLQKKALGVADNGAPAVVADGAASSRIQAISTLRAKPGSVRMRHMIERAVQTEGYACGECVKRAKKSFVSTASQTMSNLPRMVNAAVQATDTGVQSCVPSITLENLSTSQIETIDAIVRFIRARHVTGPVDSVHHALGKDSTARATMGSSVHQNVYFVLSEMTAPSRARASSSNAGGNRYASAFQHQGQESRSPPVATNNPLQLPPPVAPSVGRYSSYNNEQKPPAPVATSSGRYSSYNNPGQIMPACYVQQPAPMSKKARKRMNAKERISGGK